MQYLYLAGAIVCEVAATTALKASESFTKPVPSMIVFVGYGASFYLLSQCLATMKVGLVYAIWSGVGIVLITLLALVFFQQKVDLAALVGMALIIAGVVVLNLFSSVTIH